MGPGSVFLAAARAPLTKATRASSGHLLAWGCGREGQLSAQGQVAALHLCPPGWAFGGGGGSNSRKAWS